MKRSIAALFIAGTAAFGISQAQPPGEHGGPGYGSPQPRHRSPNAVIAAIDANGDHEITKDEMEKAFDALKALDANTDGKLDRDEIHPEMDGRPRRPDGPRGPGGPDGDHRPASHRETIHGSNVPDGPHAFGRPQRPGGPGGPDEHAGRAEHARGDRERPSITQRIERLDVNNDGELTEDEIPRRMQPLVERHDNNDDGTVDKDELAAMIKQLSSSVASAGRLQERGRFDGPPERGLGGPGEHGRRERGAGEHARGPGGPPSPERMIEHAFEFDANDDGLLSKEELRKFAESHQPGGPGEARGGRGPAGGRFSSNRPSRPARPE